MPCREGCRESHSKAAQKFRAVCGGFCAKREKVSTGYVVFAFDIYSRYGEKLLPVRLQGLDAGRQYRVKEINLMPGTNSSLQGNGELFSGEYLMTVGLNIFTGQRLNSRVIEVVAE